MNYSFPVISSRVIIVFCTTIIMGTFSSTPQMAYIKQIAFPPYQDIIFS